MAQIADPRDGGMFAQPRAALTRAGEHRAIVGDAQASAHARLLIDVFRLTGHAAHLFDDFPHEVGDNHRHIAEVCARLRDAGVAHVKLSAVVVGNDAA